MSLCVYVCRCVYIAMSSEICLLLYTEKAFFLRTYHLCMFFFLTEGWFVHSLLLLHLKKAVHLQYLFFLLMPQCYTFTLSPSFVRDNVCKSNFDCKANLEEFIREIYSEKNWMALLIQRWLMALVNPAVAVGVCMLTDTTLEYWTGAGTCLGALVPVFHFLLWQLLKNAVSDQEAMWLSAISPNQIQNALNTAVKCEISSELLFFLWHYFHWKPATCMTQK